MTTTSSKHYWYASLLIGFLLLAYRLITLALTEPGLFFDEAYYYGWSLTPDWGYYSKPPVVAWLITASTALFGNSEFSVKLPASIIYLLTAFVVQRTTAMVASEKAGFWAFITFIIMPFVSLNSWFITTDAPLLLCWSLTTHFFIKAQRNDQCQYWFLAGLFGGLGLLSKYSMILLPGSVAIMYLFHGDYKKLLHWKFWLTIATALVVFAPNVYWQFQNGFPSFIHTAELANKPGWDGNPHEFIPAQLIVFGPVAVFLLLSTLKKSFRHQYPEIWYLSWVPLFIFSAKSIQGEAFINWSAFAYSSASILVGIVVCQKSPTVKGMHIGMSLLMAAVFYHYPFIQSALGIEKTKHNTPYARVDGWREISQQVNAIAQKYPSYFIGSESRTINAYLNYYIPDVKNRLRTINRNNHVANQYELFYLLKDSERPIIWLSNNELDDIPFSNEPASESLLTTLKQRVYPSYQLTLWVYLVK
ncbi:MAG: glycosyltransferase family 39 protein [Reinekea sp.]|jgi:4-amino-4-deoxy-L-arabinose transferase-like glycosyltransferase